MNVYPQLATVSFMPPAGTAGSEDEFDVALLEVLKPRAPHVFALRDELPLVGDGARVEVFDKARGYGVAADVAVVSGVEGLDEAGEVKECVEDADACVVGFEDSGEVAVVRCPGVGVEETGGHPECIVAAGGILELEDLIACLEERLGRRVESAFDRGSGRDDAVMSCRWMWNR